MRKALRLAEKALSILLDDWGYIYGTSGQLWTTRAQEDLKAKYAMNPTHYKDYKLSAEIGDKWIGHHVADCSGLIVYLCKAYDVSVPHGSNSIWKDSLSEKWPINGSIPVGAVVLKARGTDYYHIGIYVGDGEVVEAQGTKTGVVKSKLDTWSHYGLLKDFDYTDGDLPELQPGQAVVDVPNDGALKVRQKPSTVNGKVIDNIREGNSVEVLAVSGEWAKIRYKKDGYVMKKYLYNALTDKS